MEQTATSPVADQTVFISHGDCIEDAEYVADLVRERFGVTDVSSTTWIRSSAPIPAPAPCPVLPGQ